MTAQQLLCLDLVRGFHAAHGRGPTYQQLADRLGLATRSAAFAIVARLAELGHLEVSGEVGGISLVGTADLARVPTEALLAELSRRGELAA